MNRRGYNDRYIADEDAAIVAQWTLGPICELAAVLDRSAASIEQRAQRLVREGLLDRAQRWYLRPWPAVDDDRLRDQYGTVDDAVLARRLGRSVPAVLNRAFVLGVRKANAALSALAVGEILGIDSHKVRVLIDRGLLRARRAPWHRGGRQAWQVDVAELERFLAESPEWYDWRRVADEPWRAIARNAQVTDPVLTAAEAGRLLGVPKETVIRHCGRGWLVATAVPSSGKYGRAWRIRRSALAAFRPRNLGAAWRASLGGSIAQQNGQKLHKAQPRRPVLRGRPASAERETGVRKTRWQPVAWRAS